MHEEIVISGTGGQGVLLIGRLLAEVGLLEGREVAWLPTYGAEKRGGTVACNITISDDKVGALFVTRPTAAVAMSPAALEKLEPIMKPGGLLIINKSMVTVKVKRDDIRVIYVPALEIAAELENDSASNFVILGALVSASSMVEKSSIMTAMESMFSPKYLESNKQGFIKGYALGDGSHGN
ncbi:2-oxoacid:acceptor oxidoreductase family protein [Bacteroidota bacterium]